MPKLHPTLTAELHLNDGRKIPLPVYQSNLGFDAIGVEALQKHQLFTYDQGLTSTALCQSSITYIDGEQGVLLHRGYPIDELALNKTYLDIAYLLLNGELPTEE